MLQSLLNWVNVMIYLDAAATSGYGRIDNIIIDTMILAMKKYWQNPSSLYAADVKEKIDKCRTNVAKFIGAEPNEIYFTSGATESNNWAIRGWADSERYSFKTIITTKIEHRSILDAVNNDALRCRLYYCDVDEFGFVDCAHLEKLLIGCNNEPVLVSIGLANNEIGVVQPIRQIADLVHKYDGVLHVDSTQAVGHISVNVDDLDVDMLSASGHKISPMLKGIGFLYKRDCINIKPLIYGSQESGLRGGTENTFGIIGLGEAIYHCNVSYKKIDDMCDKRDYFINILEYKFDCELNGDSYHRLPNNINVTFPQNITGEALMYTLDMSGIKVSTGSACNSKEIESSHVLKAIGLSDEQAMRTIRITLPDDITYEDINLVIDEIDKAIKLIET